MTFDLTTFVFELVNFVVLAFVLERLVYRPVAGSISDRRAALASARAEAEHGLEQIAQQRQQIDARNRELDQLREQIFAEATAEAAAERARLIALAQEDAASERARFQSLLEAERTAALAWVQEAAVDQGAHVAGRLMLELVPDAAHAALIQLLITHVGEPHDGPAPEHEGDTIEAEITSARLLSREALGQIRSALEDTLGGPVRLTVAEDERLGAGAILRIGDRILDASVAGQLELLRADARRQLASAPEPPGSRP